VANYAVFIRLLKDPTPRIKPPKFVIIPWLSRPETLQMVGFAILSLGPTRLSLAAMPNAALREEDVSRDLERCGCCSLGKGRDLGTVRGRPRSKFAGRVAHRFKSSGNLPSSDSLSSIFCNGDVNFRLRASSFLRAR